MKKITKLIVSLMMVLCLTTGCVKYNVEMEVKDDKSVTLDVIYAIQVNKSFEDEEDSEEETNNEVSDDYDFLKKYGYKVSPYDDEDEDGNQLQGVRVTKTFSNIDDITDIDFVEVDFNSIFDEDNEDKIKDLKLFYKNGDEYVANFIFDFSSEDDNTDYSSYQNMFDLKYKVKLPKEVISSNATSISEDNKELSWNLKYGKKNEVNYSFILNKSMDIKLLIALISLGIVVILLIIVIIIQKISNKKKNSGLTSINPNVVMDDINNQMGTVNIDAINNINNLMMPDTTQLENNMNAPVKEEEIEVINDVAVEKIDVLPTEVETDAFNSFKPTEDTSIQDPNINNQ